MEKFRAMRWIHKPKLADYMYIFPIAVDDSVIPEWKMQTQRLKLQSILFAANQQLESLIQNIRVTINYQNLTLN